MPEELLQVYHEEIPFFLLPFLESEELNRLKEVGMNCGVEYSSLPFFSTLPRSSRYHHSLGVALISYRFTRSKEAALAGLFHDIATPCFAHTIDFLRGDYQKQEATEERTVGILRGSKLIQRELDALGIPLSEVEDYSKYPVCDNPSPKLSADRLEYTLRNILYFGFGNLKDLEDIYDDLKLSHNEFGEEELVFESEEIAKRFGELAVKTFEVYISMEDRFAMDLLASTLKEAIRIDAIEMEDLYLDEPRLLAKLNSTEKGRKIWKDYTSLDKVVEDPKGKPVPTKIRYIDPYIENKGRLSEIDPSYHAKIDSLLRSDFSVYLFGFHGQGHD